MSMLDDSDSVPLETHQEAFPEKRRGPNEVDKRVI